MSFQCIIPRLCAISASVPAPSTNPLPRRRRGHHHHHAKPHVVVTPSPSDGQGNILMLISVNFLFIAIVCDHKMTDKYFNCKHLDHSLTRGIVGMIKSDHTMVKMIRLS